MLPEEEGERENSAMVTVDDGGVLSGMLIALVKGRNGMRDRGEEEGEDDCDLSLPVEDDGEVMVCVAGGR